MQFKRYDRYIVDMKGKWAAKSASLIGVSLFIRVVYFFGLMNFTQCSTAQILFGMVLSMGLSVGYLTLLSAIQRNVPGVYAIMGAAFFFLLMTDSFTGGALRIVLAILGYSLAGFILVATVAGYLPGKLLSSAVIVLRFIVRLFAFDLGNLGLFQWVLEASSLLILASMFCLTRALKPLKKDV